MSIAFEPIGYVKIETKETPFVIENDREWQSHWQKVQAQDSWCSAMPAIDFSRKKVLVLSESIDMEEYPFVKRIYKAGEQLQLYTGACRFDDASFPIGPSEVTFYAAIGKEVVFSSILGLRVRQSASEIDPQLQEPRNASNEEKDRAAEESLRRAYQLFHDRKAYCAKLAGPHLHHDSLLSWVAERIHSNLMDFLLP